VSDKVSRFDPRNEPRVLGCSLYAPPHAHTHAHAHAPHAHGALTTALAQPSPSHTSPAALTTALVDACGDSGRRGERAHARTDGCAVHWSVDAEGQAMDVVHALLLGEDARVCVWLACVPEREACKRSPRRLALPTGEMGVCGSLVCPNAKLILRTLAIVHEQRQQRQQQRQQRQQYQSHTAAAAPPPMPPPQGAAIWPALERWVDPVLLDGA
jgi:hypothetical protein